MTLNSQSPDGVGPAQDKESAFDDLAEAVSALDQCRMCIFTYEETLSETMTDLNHERGRLHELEREFDEALAAYVGVRRSDGDVPDACGCIIWRDHPRVIAFAGLCVVGLIQMIRER